MCNAGDARAPRRGLRVKGIGFRVFGWGFAREPAEIRKGAGNSEYYEMSTSG